MRRYAHVIGVNADTLDEYKRLHAEVWPDILEQIRRSHIRNYSIFLREPENLLFAYYEYHGENHDADMAAMAEDPRTQEWWALCIPMQKPLEHRQEGEWWAEMPSVFLMES